ncbi:MAG TPA: glycoside hydrolase family 172 protein [Pirellulales bacterium]|nr:glycoside hydrolase family 172 protein [Pirellulales bacterium]
MKHPVLRPINCLTAGVATLAVLATTAVACAEVTIESLLSELTDYGSVARWPDPEYSCKQASSYDRATVAPDQPGWFANADQNQFIREERNQGRSEKVMLDADGPGCIVRIWLTTDRNKQGMLRFYFDHETKPSLTFPAYDLLRGDLKLGPPLAQPHPGYQPDGNGGNNFYLPIPYAKHCKITWEEASQGSRYYQINYRTYAPGTAVQTFSRKALEAARPAVERANKLLLAPPAAPRGKPVASQGKPILQGMELAPRGKHTLDLPPGPAALDWFELHVPQKQLAEPERALRSLIVQMECDGERTIWCPASDFFGSGVGLNAIESWYRSVHADGTMVCRWVMPYEKQARVTLINLTDQPIEVALRANVGPWSWDDRSMHFHAVWHYEADLKTPPHRDWNFVEIAGQGVLVGDTLALFNSIATWYGEGDEKIWIDGESFPSHLGTGTEDYYGYSYAPKPPHETPFCGEPRIDQPMTQGHNTSWRTRNLDAIPFHRSLKFDIELIPWKTVTLTYAATTQWYARPGAASNVDPQPREAALPVPTLADAIAAVVPPSRKPGAVECETMKVLTKSGNFHVGEQDMDPFGGDRWSNGKHLLAATTAVGETLELEWPVADAAPRRLVLYATQAADYGTLRFRVNGKPVAGTFDGYADSVQPAAAFPLGVFTPQDKKFKLLIEVAGTNANSKGLKYLFGLDCVVVEQPTTDEGG